MNYKAFAQPQTKLDNIQFDINSDDKYDETKFQLLKNAFENFESDIANSESNLKTICDCLKENPSYNVDSILIECQAIQAMIAFLDSQDTSFVHKNLITLHNLAPLSRCTMIIIIQNFPCFINLLERFSNYVQQGENIQVSLESIYLLGHIFQNIIKYDKLNPPEDAPKIILQMIGDDHCLIDKIMEILSHLPSSQPLDAPPPKKILQLSSQLISLLLMFFENLTQDEMRVPVNGAPTVDKIYSIVQQYLISTEPLFLIPSLQILKLIIRNSLDYITRYLNKDICDRLIDLISITHELGESRIPILLAVIDIVDEFVLIIQKIERYNGFIESILASLLKQIHFVQTEDQEVDAVIITRLLQTLTLISNSQSTANILIKSQAIRNISYVHNHFKFVLKRQFLQILFSVSKYYPLDIVESFDNLSELIAEAFTIIQESTEQIDISTVLLFLQAIFALISQDQEVIEAIDMSEFMEFLTFYKDQNETCQISNRLIDYFEDEDDAHPDKLFVNG